MGCNPKLSWGPFRRDETQRRSPSAGASHQWRSGEASASERSTQRRSERERQRAERRNERQRAGHPAEKRAPASEATLERSERKRAEHKLLHNAAPLVKTAFVCTCVHMRTGGLWRDEWDISEPAGGDQASKWSCHRITRCSRRLSPSLPSSALSLPYIAPSPLNDTPLPLDEVWLWLNDTERRAIT